MKLFLLGVLAAVAAGLAVGAGVIYSGAADVAADSPHHPALHRALATARRHAVARNARDIDVPADLNDPQRLRRGAGNYAAMCADCHLSPGETESEIRKGLYPVPPDLTEAPRGGTAAERAAQRFWVIKHGIKSTAMAAWGRGGMSDGDIWDLVAFVDALPAMGAGEYRAWVAASDGHSHGGRAADHHNDASPPAAAPAPKTSPTPHSHDDGHHDHAH